SRGVSLLVPDFDNLLPGLAGLMPVSFAEPDAASRIEAAVTGIPGMSAYAAEQAMARGVTVSHADGNAIWARGFGGQRVQPEDGLLLHTVNQFYGGAFGAERRVWPNLRVGGFVGAGATRSTIDFNYGDTDSELIFAGAYARYDYGAAFLNAAVQGGLSRNTAT